MKRVFLIHGWDGRPDNHWFPWLKAELVARHVKVFAPQMPNAANPKVSEWLSMLSNWVGKPDANTFFVGHSLGCVAIARYITSLPPKAVIGGAVFVAGFSGDINIPEIAEFYTLPCEPEKVKSHGGKFVAIFSDNDKYVPLEKALEFAHAISAKTVLEKGRGHFQVNALPSVLDGLLPLLKANSPDVREAKSGPRPTTLLGRRG